MTFFNAKYWQRLGLFSLGISLGILTNNTLAKEGRLTVPMIPTDFAEVESYVKDANSTIPANLNNALCGGWDKGQSVGDTVGGGVAKVTGLPGRKILDDNPLNSIDLGVALKEDAFYFPVNDGDTCGFISACLPGTVTGGDSRRIAPFFANNDTQHPCQRPLDGVRDDYADPLGVVNESCGGGQMTGISNDADFCPTLFANNPKLDGSGGGTIRTPDDAPGSLEADTAGGICQKLNEDWIYGLWRKQYYSLVEVDTDVFACVPAGWIYQRKNCTAFDDPDIKVAPPPGTNYSARNSDGACNDGAYQLDSYRYCCTDAELGSALKNCVACQGAECHKGIVTTEAIQQDLWYNPEQSASDLGAPTTERRYYSFFRHYLASYIRDKLTTGVIEATKVANNAFDDSERINMPVPCFGFWWWYGDSSLDSENRFNPETSRSARSWFRCVISSYYPEGHPLGDKHFFKDSASDEKQMQFTQAGKGAISGNHWELDSNGESQKYADPAVDDPERLNNETWMRDLSSGFSLLSGGVLTEDNQYDLTDELMVPDTALQRATVQRYVPSKQNLADNLNVTELNDPKVLSAFKETVLSKGALIKSFDDTATYANQERIFTNWWQNVENTMNAFFTPPTVQLVLPPSWSIDLNPLHPLLTPKKVEPDTINSRSNPEYQTIDIQLQLHEDLLGEVASYLEDSILLQYAPAKVPVVVPTGSAKEFRAIAQRWCSIAIEKGDATNCNEVSGEIGTLIERLHEYADRIDESRILRAQAMELDGKFLQLHTDIQKTIGEWVLQNTAEFLEFQEAWEEREALKEQWQDAQKEMWKFHDVVNQPWCMNQRFTAPIYSLLDPWFPTASGSTTERPITAAEFPTLPAITPQTGVILDLSGIYIGTGAFTMPVLEPLTVKIDTLEAGDASLEGTVPTLAPLPPVPDFSTDFETFIPTSLSGSNAPLTFADAITLDTYDIEDSLNEIKPIITQMQTTYAKFWNAALIDPDSVDDGTEEDCYAPNTGRCVHYEFDLHERFMRIGSRPNVYLKEDFDQVGQFRDSASNGPHTCLDTNFDEYKTWVCQVLSPIATLPKQAWKIETSGQESQKDKVDALRARSLNETLVPPSGTEPIKLSIPREQIVPTFQVPEEINLLPNNP